MASSNNNTTTAQEVIDSLNKILKAPSYTELFKLDKSVASLSGIKAELAKNHSRRIVRGFYDNKNVTYSDIAHRYSLWLAENDIVAGNNPKLIDLIVRENSKIENLLTYVQTAVDPPANQLVQYLNDSHRVRHYTMPKIDGPITGTVDMTYYGIGADTILSETLPQNRFPIEVSGFSFGGLNYKILSMQDLQIQVNDDIVLDEVIEGLYGYQGFLQHFNSYSRDFN